jgi:hypothetical protein
MHRSFSYDKLAAPKFSVKSKYQFCDLRRLAKTRFFGAQPHDSIHQARLGGSHNSGTLLTKLVASDTYTTQLKGSAGAQKLAVCS